MDNLAQGQFSPTANKVNGDRAVNLPEKVNVVDSRGRERVLGGGEPVAGAHPVGVGPADVPGDDPPVRRGRAPPQRPDAGRDRRSARAGGLTHIFAPFPKFSYSLPRLQ